MSMLGWMQDEIHDARVLIQSVIEKTKGKEQEKLIDADIKLEGAEGELEEYTEETFLRRKS